MNPTKAFVHHLVSPATARRAVGVAGIVAPILLLVNHSDLVLAGPLSATVLRKFALNFLVPYLVSSYSSARAATART